MVVDEKFQSKVELAGRRLLPVYKRCGACNGIGFMKGYSGEMTTAGLQSVNYTCYTCKGTGKEETELFVEI